MNEMAKKRESTPGENLAKQIIEQYHPKKGSVLFIDEAQYPDKMEGLLQKNPGLRSRIAYHVPFNDYDTAALCEIAKLIAKQKGLTFTD